mgnify:CR=1 FL=1
MKSGVYATPCDIGDAGALDGFLEGVQRSLGRIDILVNNASGFGVTDGEAGWRTSLDIDLLASVRASHKVISWMAKRLAVTSSSYHRSLV